MRTIALSLLTILLGCTSSTGTDSAEPADTDTDTDSDTDTDTDTDADTDTGTDDRATVAGTITLPDGSPAENFRVNVCRDLCITGKTDATGAYSVKVEAEVASFYVLATGESSWGVPYAPVTLTAAQTTTIDVKLNEITGTVDLTEESAEHWIGTIATLKADGTSYQTGLHEAITELTWTVTDGAGDRPPLELEDADVRQVLWLGEFEGEGSGTLSFANPGLADGTKVNVWYAALPDASGWVKSGELTARDGQPMLEGEADLPVLTAVALTVPAQ